MLKIKYEVDRNSFDITQLLKLSLKLTDRTLLHSNEATDFIDFYNRQLQGAFDAGRDFERKFKPDEDD